MDKVPNRSLIVLTLTLVLAIAASAEAPSQPRQASQLMSVGPTPGPFNPNEGSDEQLALKRES
jgi:hypothetical protein